MTQSDNLVLSTVFIPAALDRKIKHAAYELDESKSEIIRRCIQYVLENDIADVLHTKTKIDLLAH